MFAMGVVLYAKVMRCSYGYLISPKLCVMPVVCALCGRADCMLHNDSMSLKPVRRPYRR